MVEIGHNIKKAKCKWEHYKNDAKFQSINTHPKVCTSTAIYQYLAVISMNFLSASHGASVAWSSSSVLALKSIETPINDGIPMTDAQISWITSLLGLGGLVGTIVTGLLADTLGRKILLYALAILQIGSWTLIILATDATLLYTSRFLAGFCSGGMFVIIPVYIAEISEDRIRGKLGSFVSLSINLGVLLGFIGGHYLSFFTVPKFAMCFAIVFLVSFIFFPESPIFLMIKNNVADADKALQVYRNSLRICDQQSDFYRNELEKLYSATAETLNDGKVTLSDFRSKATKKSFLFGFLAVLLNAFCGVFVMTNYAATIFAEAGSDLPPNVSAIVVGVLQFIGTYLSTFLVDRIGRKPLLIASAFGTGTSLLIFGVYSYVTSLGYNTSAYELIPILSFSSMLFIAACGVLPLLSVLISELMPDKLRTIGTMSCTCLSWFLGFVTVFCFPSLESAIGLHGCILFFAGSSFTGAAFVWLYLPETKGKSFVEIQQMLESN